MKIALDTNVLAYAEGVNGPLRQAEALALVGTLPRSNLVTPLQVLEELFSVLTRKENQSAQDARAKILEWGGTTETIETSLDGLLQAIDLVVLHRLSFWDAVVLAAAAEAGCRIVLSEDMQHGFTWRGLTVVNPFLRPIHPLLAEAVAR